MVKMFNYSEYAELICNMVDSIILEEIASGNYGQKLDFHGIEVYIRGNQVYLTQLLSCDEEKIINFLKIVKGKQITRNIEILTIGEWEALKNFEEVVA